MKNEDTEGLQLYLMVSVIQGVGDMNPKEYIDERYPLSELTGRIIAAARVVHQELGPGFVEVIYQRALGYELPAHGVEFEREVRIDVLYRGKSVGKKRVDFVVGDHSGSALIEIKAKAKLEDIDFVQTLSYLKASNMKVGTLLNFGSKRLEVKRLAN